MAENKDINLAYQIAIRAKIGCTVSVALEDGKILTVTIKSPQEANPTRGIVSYESPLGNAILSKREGELFSYAVGDKIFNGKVLKIGGR